LSCKGSKLAPVMGGALLVMMLAGAAVLGFWRASLR
jgi:hypothetical protein